MAAASGFTGSSAAGNTDRLVVQEAFFKQGSRTINKDEFCASLIVGGLSGDNLIRGGSEQQHRTFDVMQDMIGNRTKQYIPNLTTALVATYHQKLEALLVSYMGYHLPGIPEFKQ